MTYTKVVPANPATQSREDWPEASYTTCLARSIDQQIKDLEALIAQSRATEVLS